MAEFIRVDTTSVSSTASKMLHYDNELEVSFQEIVNAVQHLNQSWSGEASMYANRQFYEIKETMCERRRKVFQEYTKYLNMSVCEGYSHTESVNTSLADAFK